MDSATEILTILGGVLGTAGLWKFAEARMKIKAEQIVGKPFKSGF